MRLLKLTPQDVDKLARVNEKIRNVALVPCCYDGVDEVCVDYDALCEEGGPFDDPHYQSWVAKIESLGDRIIEGYFSGNEFIVTG